MAQYYANFVLNFSTLAGPLIELSRKACEFHCLRSSSMRSIRLNNVWTVQSYSFTETSNWISVFILMPSMVSVPFSFTCFSIAKNDQSRVLLKHSPMMCNASARSRKKDSVLFSASGISLLCSLNAAHRSPSSNAYLPSGDCNSFNGAATNLALNTLSLKLRLFD